MATSAENLANTRRLMLRTQFKEDVAAGLARPLVVPYALAGTIILPVLYLSVPHTRRPWLFRSRFAVMAAVIALNVQMMRETSSTNMATAYATGLVGTWGILWGMALLVWARPQFEAARVQRRPRSRRSELSGSAKCSNGHAARPTDTVIGNGHALEDRVGDQAKHGRHAAPDESVANALEDHEYYWQPYPHEASFLTRLGWAFDLVTAFRGSGWNHAISSIPRFSRPEKPQSLEATKLDSIPLVSNVGYVRQTTYRGFILNRIRHIICGYLVLDFCSVFMMKDPYFVFGPSSHPLPSYLQSLHPMLLSAYRSGLAFFGILGALFMILSFDQLARCLLLAPVYGARGDLWQYPSNFGSFDQVLDNGLSGFWGAWWHQSFRLAFLAPTTWLVRNGYLDPEAPSTKAVGSLIAFAQSSILHVGGSVTTLPPTKWWLPPVFFMLSWVGVVLQALFCSSFRRYISRLPRLWRRAGNLAFVILWLHFTRWAFIDDLGRSALWLFEPVPISPLRALGLGHPSDSWWRWDRDHFPVWYTGRRWWESGIGL